MFAIDAILKGDMFSQLEITYNCRYKYWLCFIDFVYTCDCSTDDDCRKGTDDTKDKNMICSSSNKCECNTGFIFNGKYNLCVYSKLQNKLWEIVVGCEVKQRFIIAAEWSAEKTAVQISTPGDGVASLAVDAHTDDNPTCSVTGSDVKPW